MPRHELASQDQTNAHGTGVITSKSVCMSVDHAGLARDGHGAWPGYIRNAQMWKRSPWVTARSSSKTLQLLIRIVYLS
ncbi:hypothetical protein J1614_011094 [Plenodomus biglobosus]|nr:hypothetical protein J1614_011094 [Plenodomus biglobosus]